MKTYSSLPGRETLIPIACNLCGESRHKEHWSCEGFSFVQCKGCGVVYQNPQPVLEKLLERYDDQYFQYEIQNEAPFLRLILKGLEDVGFPLNPPQKNALFLDVGCATGLLLDDMRNKGWATLGVEVCKESSEYGRKVRKLDIRTNTLETAGLPSESVDVAHMSHLIEHVTEPLSFLKEVQRVLKPGGTILVTTPCTSSLQALWFGPRWRSAIADHLYLFSKKNLLRSLQKVGFSGMKIKKWGGLAQNYGPKILKSVLDPCSKIFNFGDVMIMSGQKAFL